MINIVFYMDNLLYDDVGKYDAVYKQHPQKVLSDLGITYKKAVPQSICNVWRFFDVHGDLDKLPKDLYMVDDRTDLSIHIGYGLSVQDVINLQGYATPEYVVKFNSKTHAVQSILEDNGIDYIIVKPDEVSLTINLDGIDTPIKGASLDAIK